MDFNEYQQKTHETAIYPNVGHNFVYPMLGLCGEVGEVAEHIKKAVRDDDSKITPDRLERLQGELGDVLWYVARLADELGLTLDHIAASNLTKLFSRKQRSTLHGSGSDR